MNFFGLRRKETNPWDAHPEFKRLDQSPILAPGGKMRPLYIRIETVNLCNNDCIICAYGDQSRVKEGMTQALFEKVLSDYEEMGGGYVSLTPLVGDVFLDRLLTKRIEYLRQCEFVTGIGLTTNAAMAHRFSDAELAAIIAPLQRISISIYGLDPAEYEAMTRKKTYARMVEGIKRIVAAAAVPVSLEFRLLKERSEAEIHHWLEHEIAIAPDQLGTQPGIHRAYVNSAITKYANWGIYGDANRPLPDDAQWYGIEKRAKRPQCLIPIFAFMVFSNGNVSFCPCDNFDDTEELRLGNAKDASLSQLYNSARAKTLWNWSGACVPDFCQNCSFHIPISLLDTKPDILTNPYQIVGAG